MRACMRACVCVCVYKVQDKFILNGCRVGGTSARVKT